MTKDKMTVCERLVQCFSTWVRGLKWIRGRLGL